MIYLSSARTWSRVCLGWLVNQRSESIEIYNFDHFCCFNFGGNICTNMYWNRNIIFSQNKLANVSGIWRPNWDSESTNQKTWNLEKKLMRKFPCYAGIHCGCQADDFGCGTMASHFIQYGKPWIVGGQHPNWAVVTWWHQRDTVNVNFPRKRVRDFSVSFINIKLNEKMWRIRAKHPTSLLFLLRKMVMKRHVVYTIFLVDKYTTSIGS